MHNDISPRIHMVHRVEHPRTAETLTGDMRLRCSVNYLHTICVYLYEVIMLDIPNLLHVQYDAISNHRNGNETFTDSETDSRVRSLSNDIYVELD